MPKKTIALLLATAFAAVSCSKVNEGDGVPKNDNTAAADAKPAAPGKPQIVDSSPAGLQKQISTVKDAKLKTALTKLAELSQGTESSANASMKIFRAAGDVNSAYTASFFTLKFQGDKNPARDSEAVVAVLGAALGSKAASGEHAASTREMITGYIKAAQNKEHPEQIPGINAPAPK